MLHTILLYARVNVFLRKKIFTNVFLIILAMCAPGSFSKDGLVPCQLCPRGQYQSNANSASCINCPGITTTNKEGSKRADECRSKFFSFNVFKK